MANNHPLNVQPAVFVQAAGFREKMVPQPRPRPFHLPPLQVDMLKH